MKTHRAKSPTKFYTIQQIAECVRLDRTVRRWIKKGRLIAYRINGLVRISKADFQAFLATSPGPLKQRPELSFGDKRCQ